MKMLEDRKAAILGIGGCALMVMGVLGSLLFFIRKEQTVATVSAGQVELTIVEPEEDETVLVPGQALKKTPAVELGKGSEEAYIRVKIDCEGGWAAGREEQKAELEDGIVFADGWIRGEDGFYYYQKKASPGSRIVVFTRITVPESWEAGTEDQTFSIDLAAEGIPADYFSPWSQDEDGNPVITGWRYTDGTPVKPEDKNIQKKGL